jgi:serine/threonine protein kinase
MDGRKALTPGTILKLSTRTGYTEYSVRREIGRGGSCIVYDASSTDNLGNDKLVRIKECYPHALRISREEDGMLRAEDRDSEAFEAAKKRLVEAYQKNHALFTTEELSNTIANTSNLYGENGTIYIVSTWLNGQTFADAEIKTLHGCISLVLSTARVLKNIHDAGYLYLDLKPENILTIKGSFDLVQLFDFDSMIAMADLEAAIRSNDPTALRTSYTRGYAPLEQQTGKLRQICRHSDLYSLGAVLFEALWHRTPTAFDCEENAEYDFSQMAYPRANYQDALFRELTVFFHRALASYHGDRYQDAAEAVEQLKVILELADETKPYLFSSSIPSPVFFTGRKTEWRRCLSFLIRGDSMSSTCTVWAASGKARWSEPGWLITAMNTALCSGCTIREKRRSCSVTTWLSTSIRFSA